MSDFEAIKRAAVKFAVLAAVFYLAGAFASASFDLSQWDPVLRGFVALAGGVASLVASTYPYE